MRNKCLFSLGLVFVISLSQEPEPVPEKEL